MDTPKSTVQEPLKFFQWLLEEQNFRNYKQNFFKDIFENNYPVSNFSKDEITYWGIDCNGADKDITINFEEKLLKDFDRELFKVKKIIDGAISTMLLNGVPPNEYLTYIQEILKGIRTQSEKISNYYPYHPEETTNFLLDDYPFISETFQLIDAYIAEKQSMFSGNKENISEANVVALQETGGKEDENDLDKYSVKKTFGYFKGRMNSEKEYNRLIDHITQFVETGNLPNEQQFQRFRPIHNIQNEEIRYTFYVLFCENKGKIDRHILCKFIILTFDDFSSVTEDYLYAKLSTKPPLDKTYIPDFIRNYKKK